MKPGQISVRNGVEDILAPMEIINVTQGDGEGTHAGTYATDLAGRDTGRDIVYMPFTGVIKAIDSKANGNALFIQSTEPVRFADGTIDYATIMILHDNDTNGWAVGKVFRQGERIAMEGTAGKAYGNHTHFEIAKGKFVRMYVQNKQGVYHLPNNMPMEQACFIDDSVLKGKGVNWAWRKTSDVPVAPKPSAPNGGEWTRIAESAKFTLTVDKINFRSAPSLDAPITGAYGKGQSVFYDSYVKNDGYVWISWISASTGERRYMACRVISTNEPWGTFK